MTEKILSFLSQGWIGTIVGIIGILFGWFYNSHKDCQLVYQLSWLNLIGNQDTEEFPDEVEILFKNEKVSRLNKVYIRFWNSGNKTVHGENVAVQDPLKIVFNEDAKIVKARVIQKSRDINNFKLNINKEKTNQVEFCFDFFDPKDGVVIEILHTSKRNFPKIKGTIREMPKGIQYVGEISPSFKLENFSFFPFKVKIDIRNTFIITTLSGILGILIGALFPHLQKIISNFSTSFYRMYFFITGIIYSSISVSIYLKRRIKSPKELEMNKFE